MAATPLSPSAGNAAGVAAEGRLRAELSDLREAEEKLRCELEVARLEAASQRRRADLQQGREAEAAARLEQACEQLRLEGRASRRRAEEAEAKLLQVEAERDALARANGDLASEAAAAAMQCAARAEGPAQASASAATAASGAPPADGSALPAVAAASATAACVAQETEALRARAAELESEVASLRLALAEGDPDRRLAARLREQHARYEEELQARRGDSRDLADLRVAHTKLERAHSALQSDLDAREARLQAMEESLRFAESANRDLGAFRSAAAAAVAASRGGEKGDMAPTPEPASASAAAAAVAGPATPLDLSMALARLQTEVGALRRERAEFRQRVESAAKLERQTQLELGRARTELGNAAARVEALQIDLRRARDECATHQARVQVLREAIAQAGACGAGAGPAVATASAGEAAELSGQLAAAQRRGEALEALAKTRQQVLEQKSKEVDTLKAEIARLADVEARARRLEQVNTDLWDSSRELEQQQGRLVAELDRRDKEAELSDRLCRDGAKPAKIPRLDDRSPGAAAERAAGDAAVRMQGAASEESAAIVVPAAAAPQMQAEQQLDRFKRATRKHVQDFREGIYELLGWKVEMKGEGGSLRWHLSSRYTSDASSELVFQLRPAESGRPPAFDLLRTPWAEQLQDDRQAAAFLEAYSSTPGFLAAITSGLVAQRSGLA